MEENVRTRPTTLHRVLYDNMKHNEEFSTKTQTTWNIKQRSTKPDSTQRSSRQPDSAQQDGIQPKGEYCETVCNTKKHKVTARGVRYCRQQNNHRNGSVNYEDKEKPI